MFADSRLNTGLAIIVLVGALMFYLQSVDALDLGKISQVNLILMGVFVGFMIFLVNYFNRRYEGMEVEKTEAPVDPRAAARAREVGNIHGFTAAGF